MGEEAIPTEGGSRNDCRGAFDPDTANDIVLATFDHLQQWLLANEEMGERRLQVYLTIIGAAGVALGLVADVSKDNLTGLLLAAIGASVAVWVLGLTTLLRIGKRDVATTRAIEDLAKARSFAYGQLQLAGIMPWGDPAAVRPRRWRWVGLAAQLTVINSIVAAVGAGGVVQLLSPNAGWLKMAVGGLALVCSYLVHRWLLGSVHRKATAEQSALENRSLTERHRGSP